MSGDTSTAIPALSNDELARYSRHLILPEVGAAGQERLKAARILMIGAGGLGSPIALYLAAAGIGTLGIVDFDRVETSNLHRQVLFGDSDLGVPKVEAARRRLTDVNPHVDIVTHEARFDVDNALDLVADYDVVIDGSDNFRTRYLVSDACVRCAKPLVWGAVQRFEGQVAVFDARQGACYRCLFPEPPPAGTVPSCAEGGVLGVLPGMIGTLQANEAIKLVLGIGEPLVSTLLVVDALRLRFRKVKIRKRADCPGCGEAALSRPLAAPDGETCAPAEEPMTSETPTELPIEITVETYRAWREEGRPHLLLDVREPWEAQIGSLPDATLIPLGTLGMRLDELDERAGPVVIYCHHGSRSMHATQALRHHGIDAINLAGGIDAWSLLIDPAVARY
ncbi:MAG: molybdopterin-synthase adenylyltransferase MoeB [Acidobacteriota bacterium]